MITIDLKLYVTLAEYAVPGQDEYKIGKGATIEEVLTQLGIPPEKVKLIFVNGRKRGLSHPLEDKDRVGLFPPVGGG